MNGRISMSKINTKLLIEFVDWLQKCPIDFEIHLEIEHVHKGDAKKES